MASKLTVKMGQIGVPLWAEVCLLAAVSVIRVAHFDLLTDLFPPEWTFIEAATGQLAGEVGFRLDVRFGSDFHFSPVK